MEGSDGVQQRFEWFARALRASPHNLLSPKALAELEDRHLPEAAVFARELPQVARILDIGSGGGLPGVVIAIMRPETDVHLLEATGKKARFLEELRDELGLSMTVHHGRAESLAKPPLSGSFDVVTARAVAPLSRLVGWCAPYLRPGGTLHAIKGERWEQELEEARSAITAAGLTVQRLPETADRAEGDLRPLVLILGRTTATRTGRAPRLVK